MSEVSTDSHDLTLGERLKRGVHSKILIPAAATLVSVGVSYLIKKLPLILEEKVLPKLQEAGAKSAASAEPVSRSEVDAADEAGADIEDVTSEADEASSDGESSEPSSAREVSTEEREEERRTREERRRERRRAMEKAA